MVSAAGNGDGRGVAEALGDTYQRLVEENEDATSVGWGERIFGRLAEVLAYVLGWLFIALIVLGALALIASLWRVVRWGLGL